MQLQSFLLVLSLNLFLLFGTEAEGESSDMIPSQLWNCGEREGRKTKIWEGGWGLFRDTGEGSSSVSAENFEVSYVCRFVASDDLVVIVHRLRTGSLENLVERRVHGRLGIFSVPPFCRGVASSTFLQCLLAEQRSPCGESPRFRCRLLSTGGSKGLDRGRFPKTPKLREPGSLQTFPGGSVRARMS